MNTVVYHKDVSILIQKLKIILTVSWKNGKQIVYSFIKTYGFVHLIVLFRGITYDFVHCSYMCDRPALYIPQEY